MSTIGIPDILKRVLLKNEQNQRQALRVDTQSIESTHSEEITTDVTNYDLITPTDGNKIIAKDVFITINDPGVGEVAIDFSGEGEPIARLYGSQFSRTALANLTKEGEIDGKVQISADANGNKLFVVVNYVEVKG